jgi:hypothetical protein
VYEHHREPVLNRQQFLRRVTRHGTISLAIVLFSLAFGTVGYHVLGRLSWIDAILNAAMILTGMGPANPLVSWQAKLFATFFALYSGIVFIAAAGILTAPFLHRMLHRLHVDK